MTAPAERSTKIVGWEGICFIPGDGIPDATGRILEMSSHFESAKPTPKEAWEDAKRLGAQHSSEYIAIRPVTEIEPRKRKVITYVVYEN